MKLHKDLYLLFLGMESEKVAVKLARTKARLTQHPVSRAGGHQILHKTLATKYLVLSVRAILKYSREELLPAG